MDRKTAIVTGAASGIGQAVADDLLTRGWTVGGLDRGTDGVPDECMPLVADLTDAAAVTAAVGRFVEEHGRLDLLVGNAGVSCVGTIEDGDEDQWQRVFDVNVFGQFRVVRAALPWLREVRGNVVLMGSCSAAGGVPERAVYSASKGAVHALVPALAVDLLADGVRVNGVAPATVDTPFIEELCQRADDPAAERARLDARQPTGRMVAPAEVAEAVAYLATAGNVTGTILHVDGGLRSLRPRRP